MDLFNSGKFGSRVRELMSQHRVPGLAIAVVQGDETDSRGYGHACLETSRPCTVDTLFDIASCSKSLTAASVGLLVEDDEGHPSMRYDATMSSLLPEDFIMSSAEHTSGVTVEDVLSHRTGMAKHDHSYMSPRAASPDDAKSVTRNLRNLPVAAPLRSRYLYCDMMYTVATYLVEVHAKQKFSDFLEQRFFAPLNMASTHLQPSRARANGLGDRIATGYQWDQRTSTYRALAAVDRPEAQGAGSLMTSANDFVRWVKALVRREGPVTEALYRGLVRQRSLVNPGSERLEPLTSPLVYAAGLETHYYRGYAVVGHNGVAAGFGSRFFFLPDLGFGAVIMGNAASAVSVAGTLSRELIDAVLDVPEKERVSRVSFGKAISAVKGRGDVRSEAQSHDQVDDIFYDSEIGEHRAELGDNKLTAVQVKEPQTMALGAYVGRYSNPGYHSLAVQIKDGKLFVDATDRSTGFTLMFEHSSGQTRYMAHISDIFDGSDNLVRAEFVFVDGRAVRMGLEFEEVLEDLIWFELE
ncbi:beta-lactamase family protein [Hypoxylon sp. NC1633]|nr:beta-lactamase family protein [Hypoxylon sp. NC1633]